jgi:hypothetical protein
LPTGLEEKWDQRKRHAEEKMPLARREKKRAGEKDEQRNKLY